MDATSAFSKSSISPRYSGFNSQTTRWTSTQRVAISEPTYDWIPSVTSRLEELVRLKPGWDGYNAAPVSLENAYFAMKMLESICSYDSLAPQIVPGVDGDLQLEWHTQSIEIELHILAPYNVQAWVADPKTFPEGVESTLRTDFTEVARQLKKITEHNIDRVAAA